MKHSLLLCLLLFAGTTCAFSDEIYVSPPSPDATVGQTFGVLIDITDIPDVYAFQFTLNFDPTLLALDSITEGPLFADTNNSFPLSGDAPGTVSFYDTLLSPPGVNGPGNLAVVNFTAISAGTSPLDLSNVLLSDSNLDTISVTPVSGRADVVTAEPASIGLLALGLGLMIFGKWRRSKQGAVV